jgi:hypothetical protein
MRTRLRPGPPEKGTTAKVAETGNLDLRLPLLSSNGQLEIPGQRALKGALSRGCQLRTAPSASSLRFCCSGLSAEALIAESVDKVTERSDLRGNRVQDILVRQLTDGLGLLERLVAGG